MSHSMVSPLASSGLPRRPMSFPEVRLRPLLAPKNISSHCGPVKNANNVNMPLPCNLRCMPLPHVYRCPLT
eukprot:4656423-Pyramimonas_sp.AAC.1